LLIDVSVIILDIHRLKVVLAVLVRKGGRNRLLIGIRRRVLDGLGLAIVD